MRRNPKACSRASWLFPLALALLLSGTAPSLARAQAEAPPFDIPGYEIDLELLPETHQLRATARFSVTAREPLASLTLHLNRNLKVDRATGTDRKAIPFEQQAAADTFRLDLAQPLGAGQSLPLTVDYQGAFDPALHPPAGPQLAAISPGNSFLLPDAHWFPQGANPWTRISLTLAVTVPAGETVIASGHAPPGGPAPGGKRRFQFRTSEPTLPGTLVAGRFEKSAAPVTAPLTFYLRTVPASYAATNAEKLADILAFFSERFGPLARPELALVETLDNTWQVHSTPGLLLLPTGQWEAAISPRLLAREVAKQWWGARVTPASPSDVWLRDGLARYSEALYWEHSQGAEALPPPLQELTVAALVDESAGPIANAAQLTPYSPEYDSVVRDKGAMVFHMLRRVLGEEVFFRLLRAYHERLAGRSATLADFEQLAEEVSGQPLDYFFAEWLRSTGVPEFQLTWVIKRTQKGFRVEGTLKQQLEIFRMPVEIRVGTEGPPVSQMIEVTGLSTEFAFDTFGRPLSQTIQIDPDFHLLKYTPQLRVQVAIARGESLFQRGKYFEAIREYQKALEVKRTSSLAHYRMGETFFEQRNYQAAANSFREAINGDQEPKWTVVWSHIFLGKVFDITGQRERAINEYRRAVESGDDSQGALAEAQKYLNEPYRREARTIEHIEEIERR